MHQADSPWTLTILEFWPLPSPSLLGGFLDFDWLKVPQIKNPAVHFPQTRGFESARRPFTEVGCSARIFPVRAGATFGQGWRDDHRPRCLLSALDT